MQQKTNNPIHEKQASLPPLRRPLMGLAAKITDSILLRRAMRLEQVQELDVPCDNTDAKMDAVELEMQRKSRQETTRQVLDKLYRHGYIRRVLLPTDQLGRKPWLYGAATWKAVCEVAAYHERQLTNHYGAEIPQALAWKTKPQTLAAGYGWSKTEKLLATGSDHLIHFLREVDLNVILTLACRQGGYEIVAWNSDLQVRRRHQDVRVTYISPTTHEHITTAVIPDGWYVLQDLNTGTREGFFIEIDQGTQTLRSNQSTNEWKQRKSWSNKFLVLVKFFEHGHFEALYGAEFSGKVVIVTTSQLRMQRLQTLCEESGGGTNFLFTFFDIFTPKNVLTQPIFQQAGTREWVRLFGNKSELQ